MYIYRKYLNSVFLKKDEIECVGFKKIILKNSLHRNMQVFIFIFCSNEIKRKVKRQKANFLK